MSFIYITIKNHFHINGFALSLALKVRFFGTRKWPVALEVAVSSHNFPVSGQWAVMQWEYYTAKFKMLYLLHVLFSE